MCAHSSAGWIIIVRYVCMCGKERFIAFPNGLTDWIIIIETQIRGDLFKTSRIILNGAELIIIANGRETA